MMKLFAKHRFELLILILFMSNIKNYCQQETMSLPPNDSLVIPAINFKDTDIRDVLRSIAYEDKTNIVIENDISSKVSVALFNVTVFNAVKIIAEDNGFLFSYDSLRFYIKTKKIQTPPLPPPPPEPEPVISYKKGKISMDVKDVDIQNFVDKLRITTKKNFLITSGTSGKITGLLTNVSFKSGLDNLLLNNGFYLTDKDSIFYISRSRYYSSLDAAKNQVRGSYWVSAHSGKVTIDVSEASVDHILDDIANQLNLQIVKLQVPDAKVTVKCSDVPLETALNYIFEGTDFSYKKDEGAFIIGNKTSQDLQSTKLIKLLYLRADKFKESIPATLTKQSTVGVSIEHNALVVTGSSNAINSIKDYVAAVDKPVPQVMIEALVVDYNLSSGFQFGVNAGRGDSAYTANATNSYYPGVNITASGNSVNKILKDIGTINLFGSDINIGKLGKLPSDFYVNLQALESKGIANVKSQPILSTLNGHTASLKIGTTQNYVFNNILPITNATNSTSTYLQQETIQKIEASISFEITPWVGPNDELTIEVKPDFQTPVGAFSPDKNLIPAINTRSMVSTVRIRDGETIILGGMIQDSNNNTQQKFPFIGDIPIIGALFTNSDKTDTKSELMIYITPRISYGDELGNLYFNGADQSQNVK